MKNADFYIPRGIDQALASWKCEEDRKPLLIRGPRQVGKSSAVRHLAQSFEYFIDVDFEAQRDLHALFNASLNPVDICEQLSLYYSVPIIEGKLKEQLSCLF